MNRTLEVAAIAAILEAGDRANPVRQMPVSDQGVYVERAEALIRAAGSREHIIFHFTVPPHALPPIDLIKRRATDGMAFDLVDERSPGTIDTERWMAVRDECYLRTPRGDSEIAVRPAVARLAAAMERQLRAHDQERGTRGWALDTPESLLARAAEELSEVATALRDHRADPADTSPVVILDEAADVANFMAMVADVVMEWGAHPAPAPVTGGHPSGEDDE